MEIIGRTIGDVWTPALRRIISMGDIKYIPHHNQYVVELDEPLMLSVSHPLEDIIPEGSGWNKYQLELYADQYLEPFNDRGFVYTYGSRLQAFGQIHSVINKLRNDPASRQAVAITWRPVQDNMSEYPPCMMLMDFKIYGDKISTAVYFRSNDMFQAWPQNFYGIAAMAKYISTEVLGHIDIGRITTISSAPHIYVSLITDACILAYGLKDGMLEANKLFERVNGVHLLDEGAIS